MKLVEILNLNLTNRGHVERFYEICERYNLTMDDTKELFKTLKEQKRWE